MAIQTDDIFDRCSKGMILYFCYLSPVLTPLESLRYTKSI
ncbi:hypothetical protein D1BOALGB6SA_5708 [Olavius sp. associated proteobacterium Delta 1]|nr:hypothetical protein D1BOALGB6SA_5708 [Olavius sp. associated proteobacterium Delta 1]